MNSIVIFDPHGVEPEGEILTAQRLAVARAHGVVTLPVDVDMMRATALGGYAKRAYGKGWRFDALRAGRGCPLVLYAAAAHPTLHWVVRLVADGPERQGQLRVAVDTGQLGVNASGLSPVTPPILLADLGEPDAGDGWTCHGHGTLSLRDNALAGFMLYGTLSGARVAWWAVSQGSAAEQ
jgi:hypothetical protein